MKRGLSVKLLLYIVLCSSCLTLVTTAIQLYFDYHRDREAVYEKIRYIEKSYLHSLTNSAYDMDSDQLRLQLQCSPLEKCLLQIVSSVLLKVPVSGQLELVGAVIQQKLWDLLPVMKNPFMCVWGMVESCLCNSWIIP